MTDFRDSLTQRWWIATDELHRGGRKVIGPFESRDLALQVRTFVEKVNLTTYWVVQEAPTSSAQRRSAADPEIPWW